MNTLIKKSNKTHTKFYMDCLDFVTVEEYTLFQIFSLAVFQLDVCRVKTFQLASDSKLKYDYWISEEK